MQKDKKATKNEQKKQGGGGSHTGEASLRDKVGETHCEREVCWYLEGKEKKEKKVDEGGVKKGGFFLLRKISNGVTEKRGRAKTGQVTYW